MKNCKDGLLRLIAVFKLFKAATLIAIGVGALKLIHSDVEDTLIHWITVLGLDPGSRYVDQALSKIASLPPGRLKDIGLVSFLYAALFLTEGIGLWLLKPWAEWLTTILTASLVPLEVFEIHHHPTIPKVLVLAINIAVVGYLLIRIRRDRSERRGAPMADGATSTP